MMVAIQDRVVGNLIAPAIIYNNKERIKDSVQELESFIYRQAQKNGAGK